MKRNIGEKTFDTLNIVILGIFGLATLYPFWNVLCVSLIREKEYYNTIFLVWPHKLFLDSYQYIFGIDWLFSGFKTSVIVTVLGTILKIFLICTASYVLSTRRQLPGKKLFTTYFLFTMYFSGGVIPYYLVCVKYLPLYNTLASLIITSGLDVWGFMVLRTFFREIPSELSESAKMDGANEFTILLKIIIPLSLPALATLTLFSAVGFWDEWYRALYFIDNDYKQPIQMVLRRMVLDQINSAGMRNNMDQVFLERFAGSSREKPFMESIKAATIMVATIPILLVYPFLQKYFAKGVMIGSIKG